MGGVRVQRVRLPSGAATWTVIGGDGLSIEAAEEYLEYLGSPGMDVVSVMVSGARAGVVD